MSFRISRSSGIEPASRRRSLSQSRVLEGGGSSSSTTTPDYYPSSTSSRRPYTSSSNYYSPNSAPNYASGSRRNTYNPASSYSASSSSPYMSKYSNYDNGVTVAGLNLSLNGNSGRYSAGGSNLSLNASSASSPYQSALSSSLYRSHSLREQERKSRNRNRNQSANSKMYSKRSQSASSDKSEGYEVRTVIECSGFSFLLFSYPFFYCFGYISAVPMGINKWFYLVFQSGAEDSRKSRLSSGSNTQSEAGDQRSPSTNKSLDNNGDFIDYKALYEASQ